MKPEELIKYSPITWFFREFFGLLKNISLANILFKDRVTYQSDFHDKSTREEKTKKRGRQIELYIFMWFIIEVLMAFINNHSTCSIYLLLITSYRIIDIMQASLNLNLFDRLRHDKDQQLFISSVARTVILSVWNFFELAVCFGIIYASFGYFNVQNIDAIQPYYFSAITQLTIGYGDMYPVGYTRVIVMVQGCFSFALALIALSRVISFLPRSPTIYNDET